ncbi:DUF7848 domain-containing protein [Streptomyces varsoviensis]|uniref:DUF7848 domain-containing protein n=1 Tax=Streptomyces varsoviensis TaxID=67373 RepID=UPI000AE069C7|nr:hypothetical protein [Streptomyces varsoviensis]
MNRVYRYVPWKIELDPLALPVYRADCVTGEETDCGEMIRSGGPEWIEEWMRRHTQETGHTRYCRTVTEYVTLEPPPGCERRPAIGETTPTLLVLPSRPTSGGAG